MVRRIATRHYDHIQHIVDDLHLMDGDLSDQGSLDRIVKDFQPDEVYNLAAQSFVNVSWKEPITTGEITGLGALRLLESVRTNKPDARVYQASSSEMFGNNPEEFLDENSPMLPTSPYAIAKLYAHYMTINYRKSYEIPSCAGILFNHESPRRGMEFVTRKISYAAACIAEGIKTAKMHDENKRSIVRNGIFQLGALDSTRDWGYAGDYVEAMWLMLQQEYPDEYVIATGKSYSVQHFVEVAFAAIGKDWKAHVEVAPDLKRPSDLHHLRGNGRRAKETLHWEPKTSFEDLVKMMVDADRKYVKKFEKR